ncbi:hypothetical protein THAOC_17137 [Thalassiosira oceanica]|uniref:JmjC domain-containing protein n=1 Tax=Thalassiosira oceanica TaxID=159749 RepID=K0SBE8_THAOC|nr:hypothetical protein THAOC_17137 [Thalassiosira oceanica]|eukprot:EJK62254.1 hypothetical protein THAOC_17137 [Thalassiosira oceanica]
MVGGRTSQFARLRLHHQRISIRRRPLRYNTNRHLSHKPTSHHHGKQVDSFNAEKITTEHDDSYHARIADSFRKYHSSQTPVILRGLARGCDAYYFWRSIDYWRAAVDPEAPVDVELGLYNSGNRIPMRFADYLNYLEEAKEGAKSGETAYLAQNEVFREVLKDLQIPRFCEDPTLSVGEGKLHHTMLWLGPKGTVSPLHFDPMDNILIQLVGSKRVRLFSPDSTQHLYAGNDGNQYNTSAVDIERPDLDKYPLFQEALPALDCELDEGDSLFIPRKWWHHVRSVTMSASANVWWR